MIGQIVKAAQGNPGAAKVLSELNQKKPILITPLLLLLQLTESKSYGLWLAYKDLNDKNIDDTAKYLMDWVDNSTQPLHIHAEASIEKKRATG